MQGCQTPRPYFRPADAMYLELVDLQTILPCITWHLDMNYARLCSLWGTFRNSTGPGKHMVKVKGREMFETSRVEPLPS
jgi:hypothetical protein